MVETTNLDITGYWGLDLAAISDGTFRLLWASGAATGLMIFDATFEHTGSRSLSVPGSLGVYLHARAPDGRGRLMTQFADGTHVHELTDDDSLTENEIRLPGEVPVPPLDYWILPSGEGRLLTTPVEGQTRVYVVDAEGNPTAETIECEHGGFRPLSYALTPSGAVWASYTRNMVEDVVICAYPSESNLSCVPRLEGWGPGACKAFTFVGPTSPARFSAWDVAVTP